MNGIEEDSSGWMPKLAPYASSLSLSQRLARQMVWLCCTRRSKQERAAYRRLIYAGYRRPNPLDTECSFPRFISYLYAIAPLN